MLALYVKKIESKATYDFILNKHYAKRLPSISYAFGLFNEDEMVGILTIGKPASKDLCVCCGEDLKHKVFELNRLYTIEGLPKNTLSFFVGTVLRLLKPDDLILMSYSDSGMRHHGYIYQATNWIYTGQTQFRTDKYVEGGKHARHEMDNYDDKNKHLRKVRFSKHRYTYFTGKNAKKYKALLKYPVMDYPKGDNGNYDESFKYKDVVLDTSKGDSLKKVTPLV